jgi:type II secretory pathway component GspD/PulD (secretin)
MKNITSIFLRIISIILVILSIVSCAPKAAVKEEVAVPPAPPEELKLPDIELPKPAETRRTEAVRVEKEAEEKYVVLNFDGADIDTVISTIGELLGINYILSPGVSGKVTIQSYKKFPVKDLFQIFQTILELNGLTAVQDGSLYRIVPVDTARQQPVKVERGKELKLQLDSSFITQIVPVEYVKANDVANIVRNLMPRGTDIVIYEPANLLIITAPPLGLVKFMKILEAIDIPPTDRESIRTFVYYVGNGKAEDLAKLLKEIYAEKKTTGITPRPAPVPPRPAQPLAPVTVEGLPGELEGEVTISAYEPLNALVIKTTPRGYLSLLETLKKLDVQPRQVLIEVLIAEVTLSDEEKLGIEWLVRGYGRDFSGVGGFTQGTAETSGIIPPTEEYPVGSVSYPSGAFANIFNPVKFNALISASVSTGKFNVLASPHILALDNKEAKIEIGEEVAVATGTYTTQPTTGEITATTTTVGQIQYKTTGTILTVTPQINEKGLVTLKINQEMSKVDEKTTVEGIPAPSFKTRKATTTAVVQDGHTLVIGGLINESKDKTRTGLPLLSKIPLLGYLFGTTTETVNKTELLVMVTPHVVRSTEDADLLTKEFQNRVKTVKERIEKVKYGELLGRGDIITIEVKESASLMEILELNGYSLEDENLNVFLSEFIVLNKNIKSIKMIPEGSAIRVPLKYLKKEEKKG